MATVLESRKPATSKPDIYLQRKFADLCARVQRADRVAALLAMSLTIIVYALIVGWFDWIVGPARASWISAARGFAYLGFLGVFGYFAVQAVSSFTRRVSPYFVAHQIEKTLPSSKNILINWLDMRGQEMPAAFQHNLAARAAEQLREGDAGQSLRPRHHWVLLGVHALPTLGLVVLLLLGPSAFFASMLRAFLPFYTPPVIPRTTITLVQPANGDAEVGPNQTILFAAKIDGRIPALDRPDAPKIFYRYQASEDYQSLSLQSDVAGQWTAQLSPAQIRTGFMYKLSAGDAETQEHQVRVRAAAHVKQFTLTYQHRPYRLLPKQTVTFPNERATTPIIHAPRGSEVDLLIQASRQVREAKVEFAGKNAAELPLKKVADDTYACRWVVDQPGQFRVLFTAQDGEENTDREWYPIEVLDDGVPLVMLTQPGKDVELPINDTLELEGGALSTVGIKSLMLRLRLAGGAMLEPRPYRPGTSFELDGAYPGIVAYQDVLPLDKLNGKAGPLAPATVIEYWLEAKDCSDYPDRAGQVGKSTVYKITLLPALDEKKAQTKRNAAQDRQQKHLKKQDQQNKDRKDDKKGAGGGSGGDSPNPDKTKKENQNTENKIKNALQDQDNGRGPGESKSADPKNSSAKNGPSDAKDGPQPENKDKSPNGDEGKSKGSEGNGGEPKDNGDQKNKDDASKGNRKDGPKESLGGAKDNGGKADPMAGAKDAGTKGNDVPMPQPAKDQKADDGAPTPSAKNDAASEGPPQGNAKGVEQNGPDVADKAGAGPAPLSDATNKPGNMIDGSGTSKKGPPDQAIEPGIARGNDANGKGQESSWEKVAQNIEKLADPNEAAREEAAKELADLAKNATDPRKSDIAGEALKQNGRDPKTGERQKKKGPNLTGSGGQSPGISDDLKAAAANREFAARVGQMQLDDWKKRVTPDLLKKAGVSETEWQAYLQNMRTYAAQVNQLNAKLLREAMTKELRGKTSGASSRAVERIGSDDGALEGRGLSPPELRDPLRRFEKRDP